MTTTTPATRRTYDRQVIAAWLHGYDTGHGVGHLAGQHAGFPTGYTAGYLAGIAEGRRRADRDAAARYAGALEYTRMNSFPPKAPTRPYPEAKPLPTPTECLATWPTPTTHRTAHPPTVRHAA